MLIISSLWSFEIFSRCTVPLSLKKVPTELVTARSRFSYFSFLIPKYYPRIRKLCPSLPQRRTSSRCYFLVPTSGFTMIRRMTPWFIICAKCKWRNKHWSAPVLPCSRPVARPFFLPVAAAFTAVSARRNLSVCTPNGLQHEGVTT